MKKSILISGILLVTAIAYGQNWRVIPKSGSMFSSAVENIYYPLWIDSVSVIGTDSVFHFYRTIGYTPGCNYNEYNSRAACWAGYQATKSADSIVFFNYAGTKLCLKPDAASGSVWVFCKADSNLLFEASVMGIVADTIFGQADSVKQIAIQAYDSTGNLVNHQYNTTLFISKQNGLQTTFPFYSMFPTPEIENQTNCFNVPGSMLQMQGNGTDGVTDFGWMDSRNYPENGELYVYADCYSFFPGSPATEDWRKSSLYHFNDKTIYGNLDSIRYQYHLCQRYIDYLSDTVLTWNQDYSMLIKPDSSAMEFIQLETAAGKPLMTFGTVYDIGIPFLSRGICNKTQKTLPIDCGMYCYSLSHDSIYSDYICDCEVYQPSFVKNWGGGYVNTAFAYSHYYREIKYLHDSTQSCGTAITCNIVLGLDENGGTAFTLYPNPANDILHIGLPSAEPVTVSIYDMSGNLFYQENSINTDTHNIDVSEFDSGCYIVKIAGHRNGSATFIKL